MAIKLLDTHREHQRYRHTAQEKISIINHGFIPVLSSNISALGMENKDLLIRFHTGTIYRYPNEARLFTSILEADSKGRAFWTLIRNRNKPYIKEGKLFELESDINQPTEDFIVQMIEQPNKLIDEHLKELGFHIINNEFNLPLINIGELL